jgi:hypothetical protein
VRRTRVLQAAIALHSIAAGGLYRVISLVILENITGSSPLKKAAILTLDTAELDAFLME